MNIKNIKVCKVIKTIRRLLSIKPLNFGSFSITGLVLIISSLLASTPTFAWKLYNNTSKDFTYTVYDADNKEVDSGTVRANKDVACNWSDANNCNPTGKRGSELKVEFHHDAENYSCALTMLGGGFALVYKVDRTDVDTDLKSEWWCLSQMNEYNNGKQNVDVNGDGVKDRNAYYNIDWSDPYLVDNQNGGFGADKRNVKFFVTADPQINNADIGDGSESACNWLEECDATEDGSKNAEAVFKEIRSKFRADRYSYKRQNSKYRGVLVAGDLTQQARWDEFKFYSQISTNQVEPKRFPMEHVFDGLGNHDVDTDTEDCYTDSWARLGWCDFNKNIESYIGTHNRKTRMASQDSPHYSWTWHDVQFIQLNVFPGRTATADRSQISPSGSLSFLEDDLLKYVGTSGRPVVLVHHYGFDQFSMEDITCNNDKNYNPKLWWTEQDRIDYWNILKDFNVIGIFTGHNHLADSHRRDGYETNRWDADDRSKTLKDDNGDPLKCWYPGWGDDFEQPANADNRIDNKQSIPAWVAGSSGNGIYLDVSINACNEMTVERWEADNSVMNDSETVSFTSSTSPKSNCDPTLVCADTSVNTDASCQGYGSVRASGGLGICTETPAEPYALGDTQVSVDCLGVNINGVIIGGGTCSAKMTVEDYSFPNVICPSVSDTVECGADLLGAGPTVWDNCDANPLATCTPVVGSLATLGMTSLSCEYTDSSFNGTLCDRSFVVSDTLEPVVTPNGNSNQTLECGIDSYNEVSGGAADQCEGSTSVSVGGDTVDANSLGNYEVIYSSSDTAGNTGQASRFVEVKDTTAPNMLALGNMNQVLECNVDTYTELGAAVTDACDVNIGATIRGSVDTTTIGTYYVSYTTKDTSGNFAGLGVSREVQVKDTIDPNVTLNGPSTLTLECNVDSYQEQSAASTDICSGTLTPVPSGIVDVTTVGNYQVLYSAVDGANNNAQAIRNINVIDTTLPSISCDADITVQPVSPDGTAVTYSATSNDICDASPTVVCAQSGDFFGVGTSTLVACTSTDSDSNQSSCSLTINVLSQAQVVDLMSAEVQIMSESGVVNRGQTRALDTHLRNILASIDRDNANASCGKLLGLQSQLDDWELDGILSPDDTTDLNIAINNLSATLGCQ